jgi:hypothetical protein
MSQDASKGLDGVSGEAACSPAQRIQYSLFETVVQSPNVFAGGVIPAIIDPNQQSISFLAIF